jgi:hypothetical protein
VGSPRTYSSSDATEMTIGADLSTDTAGVSRNSSNAMSACRMIRLKRSARGSSCSPRRAGDALLDGQAANALGSLP